MRHPGETRRRLAAIIDGSLGAVRNLKAALESERCALAGQDMDELQAALEAKSHCVARLQDLEQERREICLETGFEAGAEWMPDLIAWCDEGAVIAAGWRDLMAMAGDCQAINDTNGAIILGRKQQIENTLAVVRGGSPAEDGYDFRGRENRDVPARSIAQA